MITLRQLRYLDSLARHRHFGRAAEDCAVTQPALSMQIRELEREIGGDLVERRPGDIVLTELGREVATRAEAILTATRDLVDFARHRDLLSGHLKLGIIPTLAPYVLPQVLPRLQAAHPGLRLEVRETQTKVLLEELARGALDCLMLALPAEGADVETRALFADPFLLALPAGEPLPAAGRISVDDVDQRRLILLEEGHCLRDQALAFCAAPNLNPSSRDAPAGLGATSLATVMQMVANGYGVTLVPQVAVDVEVRDPRVRLMRFAEPQPARNVGLAWRRTSPRKHDFEALGEIVKETLAPRSAEQPKAALQVAP
ncbi:MAG TPA: hydrogen peroxide-inducible genes activator [Pseudolabrys sp.]|nr:hydrogen peroxide-inducible genes activator [Pseudolabrys sp.]